ncbi:MAG: UDP-N-acetylmuramoyl-L-alanyl-D-glutamate--2,6-diaminopimelate ligase [Elusimicrobia bacterium]|nr:UDP-N-acetylmuramoyl-L-alanyl-D-glutamate--2,6-diaminopimelate ligase [Elusimicrobiota bacterium]
MKVTKLFENTDAKIFGNKNAEVAHISNDSRDIKKNYVFFAISGTNTDGNVYIKQALKKGASAIVSESEPIKLSKNLESKTAWIKTSNILKTLSTISSKFYGKPSRKLKIIGLTGTNGKTTASYILEAIYKEAKIKTGIIGTISHRIGNKTILKAANTTPSSHQLQLLLKTMVNKKVKATIMEVSSHSLSLNRVNDIDFDRAVFTNFQRDHLDFHKNKKNYFDAKLKLFDFLSKSPKRGKFAIINNDDIKAPDILKKFKSKLSFITYGVDNKADFSAKNISFLKNKTCFELSFPNGKKEIALKLLGKHNIYNALCAAATAYSLNISISAIIKGLENIGNIPGRLERISSNLNFDVFVDYAHTDAAIENVLSNLINLPHKRMITVFGCGGDRDRGKRATMGIISCSLSNIAIITNDNPRNESPTQIFQDIEKGLKTKKLKNYEIIPSRKKAIDKAIKLAKKGDIVLIAGKGHEDYQILNGRIIHFDDREIVKEAIKKRIAS